MSSILQGTDTETTALKAIYAWLEGFDYLTRRRMVHWLSQRIDADENQRQLRQLEINRLRVPE